jgi:hypothetical protein
MQQAREKSEMDTKCIFAKPEVKSPVGCEDLEYFRVVPDRVQLRILLNTVMGLRVPPEEGNLFRR